MNILATYINILSKTYQTYITNMNIILKYNFLYINAFQQELNDSYKKNDKNKDNNNKFNVINLLLYEEIYNKWLKNTDYQLNKLLKSKEFISLLSEYLTLNIDIHKDLKSLGYHTQYADAIFEKTIRNMYLASSIQKDFQLTPFDVEYINGNIRLLHYHSKNKTNKKENKVSLLIIYAQINRFHILDIHPSKSVVKLLLDKGLDIYLLDWGYPTSKDNNMSLNDYIHSVKEAVQFITDKDKFTNEENIAKLDLKDKDMQNVKDNSKKIKNKDIINDKVNDKEKEETGDTHNKISILGYCWGGIIALIFASLHNKYIKNLTLMAVPIDFSKDTTILSTWAKSIDVDRLVDEFSHIDGQILDIGFILRNPVRYSFDKYITMAKKYNDKEFVDIFISVERWLYDTPIIPKKYFKQIVNDCYKNNLLIKDMMKVDGNIINLKNVDIPLLTIVAEKDDLVSPESTLEVNNYVASKEKKTIHAPGGHVALCISKAAHERIWPEVAGWILSKQ